MREAGGDDDGAGVGEEEAASSRVYVFLPLLRSGGRCAHRRRPPPRPRLLQPIYAQGAQRLEQILVDAQVRAPLRPLFSHPAKISSFAPIWEVLTGFMALVRPDLGSFCLGFHGVLTDFSLVMLQGWVRGEVFRIPPHKAVWLLSRRLTDSVDLRPAPSNFCTHRRKFLLFRVFPLQFWQFWLQVLESFPAQEIEERWLR